MVPQGALVLDNHNGTAPGLIIEKNGKTAILLPGPPNELKPMFEEEVFPYLRKKQPEIIYSQMVKICSIGESQVAEEIQDLIEQQSNLPCSLCKDRGSTSEGYSQGRKRKRVQKADQAGCKGAEKSVWQKYFCNRRKKDSGRGSSGYAERPEAYPFSCRVLYRRRYCVQNCKRSRRL